MAQLIGNVAGVGLPRLVRFLTDLQLSGRLTVAPEPGVTNGTIFLHEGQVVGAVLDPEQGLPALEALALVCGNATFAFADAPGEIKYNLIAEPEVLQEHLDHIGQEGLRLMRSIGSLTAVPRLAALATDAHESIALTRGALRLLLQIGDERTVLDLGHLHGLRPTLEHLHELIQLRLVTIGAPDPEAVAAAAPELAHLFDGMDNHHERDTSPTPIATDPTRFAGW